MGHKTRDGSLNIDNNSIESRCLINDISKFLVLNVKIDLKQNVHNIMENDDVHNTMKDR